MKGRRSLVVLGGALAGLAIVFAGLFVRRQMRIREQQRYRAWAEEVKRTHTDNAPPRDFSKWIEEFGASEPDPATPEGREAIDRTWSRFDEAKDKLQRMIEQFPVMLASEDETAERTFLSGFIQALNGFNRAGCAKLLNSIHWGGCGRHMKTSVEMLGPERGNVAVGRYYRVVCQMVDLLWTRCGLEYEAAEADYWIYVSLRDCRYLVLRRRWNGLGTTIEQYLDDWKNSRCDDETSNFCRAHRFWEDRYNQYYKERIKRGETNWLKPLSAYYRYHLGLARSILKREPKWSPGIGHVTYDDAPGGVKP